MKIQQLRYFVQVADKGSVRAAAESLGVSAAAVSQSLRELERTVSAPLLTRESQGATLTYIGRQLLTHARLILGQIGRAEDEIGQLRGLAGGVLSVGVTPWVSQSLLPLVLGQFHTLRPDVRLDIFEELGTAHSLLRDGTLDLVIGLPPPRHHASNFFSRDLFACGMAVISRRGHPLAHCTSMAELTGQDWILTLRQDELEQPLNDMLKPFGMVPAPNNIHLARSTLIALSMLDVGDMLTVCPWPLVESPLMRNRIQAFSVREALPDMTTSMVIRRNDTVSTTAQLFIDCFKEAIETAVQTDDPVMKRVMSAVEVFPFPD